MLILVSKETSMGGMLMKKDSVGRYTAAIYRNTQSIINKKFEHYDIRSGQHDFLYVIIKNEGITQTEMCDLLNVGKATVAKAVNNLVRSGYVIKEKNNKEDKRFYRLFLTDKGRAIAPMINATFHELIEIYKNELTDEEYDQILRGLKKILENISSAKNKINSLE